MAGLPTLMNILIERGAPRLGRGTNLVKKTNEDASMDQASFVKNKWGTGCAGRMSQGFAFHPDPEALVKLLRGFGMTGGTCLFKKVG